MFEDFSSSLELICFCMENFESIELWGSAQPLRMVRSRLLLLIENLVVCWCQIAKSSGNFNSVGPIVRISSVWRSRNFRVSAYFAILVSRNTSE